MKNEIETNIKHLKRMARFYIHTGKIISAIYKMENIMENLSFNKQDKEDMLNNLLKNWGEQTLKDIEFEVHIDNGIYNKNIKNAIFMANHNSNIDTLVLLATSPKPIRMIAKKILFKIPFFGKAMTHTGFFEIDRKNHSNSLKILNNISRKLNIENRSVLSFPEGSRSRTGKLQEFKKGVFHLSITSQVPIIPITILNTQKVNGIGDWRIKDGKIIIYYHKPIFTKNLTTKDIPELITKVRKSIESKLI